MKLYLAAASADIDRTERWIAALHDVGITVTSTWTETIRRVGDANPRDAAQWRRQQWSHADVEEIANADTFWFLVPDVTAPTRGAWVEFGVAWATGKKLVCSGDTKQSIFCSVAMEFLDDADAFAAIVRLAVRP